MAEYTMPANGEFCWSELTTTDDEAARKFYGELLGWTFKESNIEGTAYSEIMVDGRCVGGIYKPGPECGAEARTHWMSYVAVADVDASARRVEELGGSVRVPPTDIPTVGRFCVINDPTGGTISLITLKGIDS